MQVAPLLQVLVVANPPLEVLYATATEFTVAPLPLHDALLLLRRLASEARAHSPIASITTHLCCAASRVKGSRRCSMASLIAGGTPNSMGLYIRLSCASGTCISACALSSHVA